MKDNNLVEKEYEKTDKTFSLKKANLIGVIIGIPILIIPMIIFYNINGNSKESNFLISLIITLAGIFIHEFIHGFTWSIFCEKKFKSIKFGIDKKTFSPYTTCTEILNINEYRLGTIMPFIITGLIPYLLGVVFDNSILAYSGVLLMVVSVGDLMILATIISERSTSLVQDHPTDCGCIVYRKNNS